MTVRPGPMSDEYPDTQPEPVMDAAKAAAAVAGVVTAVGAGFVLVGWATTDQVQQWAVVAGGIVSAVGALLSVAMPLITARGARAQVTPLASPRDYQGTELVPAVPEHGRHEATEPQAPGASASGLDTLMED